MPKLYVVRHAEPALTGVLLGRTDPPLSEAGRRDARRKLGWLQVEVTYASPLRRCRETAEAIDAPIEVLDGLAEISLGEWDGLSWEEVESRDPKLALRKTADWFRVTPPGGEPWTIFAARVMQAVDKVLRGRLPAAIIAHAATNSVIAQRMGGIDPGGFDQLHCGIEEYDIGPEAAD